MRLAHAYDRRSSMGLRAWWRRRSIRRTDSPLLGSQKEALKHIELRLRDMGVRHALIGGVAMTVHGLVRATKDIDYLMEGEREPDVHALFEALGFETLQRGRDVSSYLLARLRIDVLYARRPYSRAMLDHAIQATIDKTELFAVRPEDIIGLKLQALRNQPTRVQDRADIVLLLRLHGAAMDAERLNAYARLLGMEVVLDELRRQT